jgi:MFS superfamily sulfate permease-like transporter
MDLMPTALGLFLMAFADGVLTARTFAGRHDQHVDARQELVGLGVANVLAGVSHGYPVGASGSRTAVVDAAGVRTQLAGAFAAAIVAAVLLFLTGPLSHLPYAVLGAVIVSAAVGLVDVGAWRQLDRGDHVELAIAAVATAGVVVVGVLPAVAFAVGLSIVDVVRRSARPHDAVLGWVPRLDRYGDAAVHRTAQITPGVVVYRLDDRLFFANAGYMKARVREAVRGAATPTRAVVFDAEAITQVDIAGMEALQDLSRELAGEGITLTMARVSTLVRGLLDEAGVSEAIGAANFHPTVHAAVAALGAPSAA